MPIDPVTGSLIAGGIGLGLNAIGGALKGATAKKGKFKNLPTMTPQQIAAANQAQQLGLQQIQNPMAGGPGEYQAPPPLQYGYPEYNEAVEQPALNQFRNKVIPTITERMQALGGTGTKLNRPGYGYEMGTAASDLGDYLARLRAEYGLGKAQYGLQFGAAEQARANQLNQYNLARAQYGQNQQTLGQQLLALGQQPQFQTAYKPGGENFWTGLFGGLQQGGNALTGLGAFSYLNALNNLAPKSSAPAEQAQFMPMQQPSASLAQMQMNPLTANYGAQPYTPNEGQANLMQALSALGPASGQYGRQNLPNTPEQGQANFASALAAKRPDIAQSFLLRGLI